MEEVKDVDGSTAAYCLSLPRKTLFLSHLLSLKKFRKRGNIDGALRAFFKLEEEGLGKVLEVAGSKGSQCVSYCGTHWRKVNPGAYLGQCIHVRTSWCHALGMSLVMLNSLE